MDSGEAALWGAAIGAGSTLVISTVVPLVQGTIGERLRSERRRREQLRVVFPRLIAALTGPPQPSQLEVLAQFHVLLKQDEWQIGEMAVTVVGVRNVEAAVEALASLTEAVSAWIREEISPEQARQYFSKKTGLPVTRPLFE